MSKLVPPHGGKGLVCCLLEGKALEDEKKKAAGLKQIEISSRAKGDLIMMGIGGFSPLTGFMGKADWKSVCEKMLLADGTFWPVPVTLDISAEDAKDLKVGQEVALVRKGEVMATMKVEEIYEMTEADKKWECELVFKGEGPDSEKFWEVAPNDHPGVKMVLAQKEYNIAGPVKVLSQGEFPEKFPGVYMTPAQLRAARRNITMIFQHFNLLMQRTCLRNVCFPMELAGVKKAEAEQRARELLELVGLPDKADSYPAQLSGGQQQRVAIARALATHPKVLLCDEATSALDPNTTRQILELIRDINKKLGITVVVITHQMSVVKEICTHVAILDEGRVAESGLVGTVFAAPKSAAGRRLVFPGGADAQVYDPAGEKLVRLVFKDAATTSIPMIARLASEEGILCNVISASTQKLSETVYGSMMLGIPSSQFDKAVAFLHNVANVQVEEVE